MKRSTILSLLYPSTIFVFFGRKKLAKIKSTRSSPAGRQERTRASYISDLSLYRFFRCGYAVFRRGLAGQALEHNTPGANANAVKEHVLAALLLASRDILGGIKWVEDNKDDADIAKSAEKAKKAFAGKEIRGARSLVLSDLVLSDS